MNENYFPKASENTEVHYFTFVPTYVACILFAKNTHLFFR